jgi:hypothetical protein
MHIRTIWNDYFSGTPTFFQTKEYGTQLSLSATNVYVINCLFRSITSGSSGGALSCTSSVTYLLVESSSFLSCKTSGYSGGAIYFVNTGSGQCVLQGICGYDSCTTGSSDGVFSYIKVKNDASYKNYFNFSSISRCVNEYSNSWLMLRQEYGKIYCPSVNISMNKCSHRSAICCLPFVDSNSVTSYLSYSTFVDNIALEYACVTLWYSGSKHEIKSCNILRNTQGSGSEGTIYTNGKLIIKDSCILENTAANIFYQGSSSYTITISNCTVDSTSNNGYLTTQNTVTKSFILALNHMSTQNCHSEYDSAGTLTPIIQTPSSSKKQKIYFTCERLFDQYQLSDKFSLINILIFNFIYPYAYGEPLFVSFYVNQKISLK